MTQANLDALYDALLESGSHLYGTEAVSELDHALQCADLALAETGDEEMAVAALLHDVGRVAVRQEEISDTLVPSAMGHVEVGATGHHEAGSALLHGLFPDRVVSCVRMHVGAKRYLCTVDPAYNDVISGGSTTTLKMQGGKMSDDEVRAFESGAWFEDAVKLRRWDDRAKTPGKATRSLKDWWPAVERVAARHAATS